MFGKRVDINERKKEMTSAAGGVYVTQALPEIQRQRDLFPPTSVNLRVSKMRSRKVNGFQGGGNLQFTLAESEDSKYFNG